MRDLTQQLHRRLQRFVKQDAGFEPRSGRAAVAIMVREGQEATELLMIRRATREGDPWSGHMGFPGGRRDPEDHSNLSCALRETEEELGVDLSRWGAPLGELSDVNTGWRKDRPEMLVTPFIFSVSELPELTPNDEVDDVVWVPLHFLMDESNREPLEWEWKGQKMETDSYLYDCYRIWGLSLMMIDEMMGLLRP
jgi:8-oxo-dGTP pyrophosphatase MutT (NUDIX family)